jgi:hypothetical protein
MMSFTPWRPVLLLVTLFISPRLDASTQGSDASERIQVSFMLAHGRPPSPAELTQWSTASLASVTDLLNRHRMELRNDPGAHQAVLRRAYQDTFGQSATTRAFTGEPDVVLYHEWVTRHLQLLAQEPAAYAAVIQRAYQLVLGREAYDLEVAYWNRQSPLSFALLVGCVEDWARRNQPGLMVTGGTATVSTSSEYLITLRVSPAVAAEVRAALGNTPVEETEFTPAWGRNLLAPSGAAVITRGSVYMVAAGGDGLAVAVKNER